MDRTSKPIHTDTLPWMPLEPGVYARLLRLDGEDRTLQLKVDPGVTIAPHVHDGEVHAFGIAGHRRLGSGEIAGPGDYVYEPAGNRDTWTCIGDTPVVVQITMTGAMTTVDAAGRAVGVTDTAGLRSLYLDWCAREGHAPVALGA
ncbi:MAG: anti-sigma factor [Planctomycetes bacterium]|nr:anti-sigma factor [Planctomycetota bacterium]